MIEDTSGGGAHDYTPIKNGATAVDHWIESLRDKSLERRITTICELSGHRPDRSALLERKKIKGTPKF